jgi:hypothetical protein
MSQLSVPWLSWKLTTMGHSRGPVNALACQVLTEDVAALSSMGGPLISVMWSTSPVGANRTNKIAGPDIWAIFAMGGYCGAVASVMEVRPQGAV